MAKSRAWVIGFLRGSVAGYRRGTVPMRRVTASVLMAIEHGVSPDELLPLLGTHCLRWTPGRRVVFATGSMKQDVSTLASRRRQLNDILQDERRRLRLFPKCVRGGVQTHIAFLEQLIEETSQDLQRMLGETADRTSSGPSDVAEQPAGEATKR